MVKRSEKTLFRFALKRNEKIGSVTKNCCKRNKAKIRTINFALVGSEKFKVKEAKKNLFFSHEHAKRMQNRSRFALFRFEAEKNFLRNRRTVSASILIESKKNIKACLLLFMSIPSMVKRSEKTFILFRFEVKRKDWKRNEKFL
jgi:hypothetical protein